MSVPGPVKLKSGEVYTAPADVTILTIETNPPNVHRGGVPRRASG